MGLTNLPMLSCHFLLVLLSCVCMVLRCTSQEPQHFSSRMGYPSNRRGQRFSVFNTATQRYEPVTQDSQFFYYRCAVKLNVTFDDKYFPDPEKFTLLNHVLAGDAFDGFTMRKVGTWENFVVSITHDPAQNNKASFLSHMALEMGPSNDDAIFISAALEREEFIKAPKDTDLAITGGTQQFKGATGEVLHTGNDFFLLDHLYVAEIYVPKLKPF